MALSNLASYLGSQAFNDLCQAFVEQQTLGHTGVYPSAIAAWNSHSQNGSAVPGVQGIQPGDLVYFSANQGNGGFGHTGIYTGNNQFISATNTGVAQKDLNQWQQGTGQQLLGYVPQGQAATVGQQFQQAPQPAPVSQVAQGYTQPQTQQQAPPLKDYGVPIQTQASGISPYLDRGYSGA